ncbi:MAG: nickel-responsive transcriptional regulator NikR [Deltaproteobacteria bacterium]|nr:nickel-responsive transcriptional regulator NikR [Deltaproteobacteria bacterium]
MSDLIRFGVSLEKDLLEKFDALIGEKRYTNRSEAIRDLIRDALVKKEWQENRDVTGAITLVYDHHRRGLISRLTDIQHDCHHSILSTQHIHIDHDHCFEIIVFRGQAIDMEALYSRLKSTKGVEHAGLSMTAVIDKTST